MGSDSKLESLVLLCTKKSFRTLPLLKRETMKTKVVNFFDAHVLKGHLRSTTIPRALRGDLLLSGVGS